MSKTEALRELHAELDAEVWAQDDKWGQQDHPLIGSGVRELQREQYAQAAEDWKLRNDVRVQADWLGWDGILLEEVYEALECDTVESACEELVQVIAVAAQMILNLRARDSLDKLDDPVQVSLDRRG